MPIIGFLVKAYIAILIFRVIFTQQELTFNNVGRGVAKLTNPLFKGRHKADSDKLVPVYIVLIGIIYGVIIGIANSTMGGKASYGIITGIGLGFTDIFTFLAMFFIVCLLLGAMASPGTGAFPVFFYRVGNIWVKPVRKVVPIRGNGIVLPAILLVLVSFWFATVLVMTIVVLTTPTPFDMYTILVGNGLSFLYAFVGLLRLYMIVLIVRAVMSWFSPDPRNTLVQLVYYATEPVLTPLRRIIPPLGGLDLSALAAMILVAILQNVLYTLLSSLTRMLL